MAKTISSNLVSDALIESGEALAMKKAVPLTIFAKDFSDEAERYANGKFKNAKIAFEDTLPTVATNPTAFGADESSSVASCDVTMNLYSAPISCNWADPVAIKTYVQGAMTALAEKLVLTTTSLFTTTAFGTGKQVSVDIAGSTGEADDVAILKSIYKSTDGGLNKYLVAGTDLYAAALPSNKNSFVPSEGGYGFDGIYENNIWAASSTVKGIVTDGRAVAMVARLPEWADEISAGLTSENVFIPALGITVQFNKWADLNGRIVKASLDCAFGAALLDKSQSKIVLQSAQSD